MQLLDSNFIFARLTSYIPVIELAALSSPALAVADVEFLSLVADLVFFSSVFGVLDFGLSLLAGDKALLLDGLGVSFFF